MAEEDLVGEMKGGRVRTALILTGVALVLGALLVGFLLLRGSGG
jgi:hypothetical protein